MRAEKANVLNSPRNRRARTCALFKWGWFALMFDRIIVRIKSARLVRSECAAASDFLLKRSIRSAFGFSFDSDAVQRTYRSQSSGWKYLGLRAQMRD